MKNIYKMIQLINLLCYFDNICYIPDTGLKSIILFMSFIEMMISSNTGTLPPTRPVLPLCMHTAK